MEDDKIIMFRNRLVKVFRHLSRQARRLNVSCYRVYDHDLPEFPLCIEVYQGKVYVAEYKRRHGQSDEEHERRINASVEVICDVLQVERAHVFLKLRQRKEGRSAQYRKTGETKNEFIVQENGLWFIVNLSDYLDTGLFLDHRLTRQRVRNESAGRRVLNLFSYTGSFSVCAAAGGAERVVSVDLSRTYLKWAERNMQLNGFDDPAKYSYVHADARVYLETQEENQFDLVILDPPTFSNSQRMDSFLDIQRDHPALINACLRLLTEEGILYFSTNFSKFNLIKEEINTVSIKDITKETTPFDFEGRLLRRCFRLIK